MYLLNLPALYNLFFFSKNKYNKKSFVIGGNELRGNKFNLNWCHISLDSTSYSVNEHEKYLTVVLNRSGFLGETSFVSIAAKSGTAKNGEDYSTNTFSQVQFNPGQTVAKWKVKVLDVCNFFF